MSFDNYIKFLREHDPDVLVDLLGLSSDDLIEAFPERVAELHEREDGEDAEDDNLSWD